MSRYPSESELKFLTTSYNFFFDILEEAHLEDFWKKDPYYRLNRTKDAFLVYSEILEYEPVGWFLEALKKLRPQMEAELSNEFLLFIRNLLIHFPFFKSWDEVKVDKALINWSKPGRTIDKFLTRYSGQKEVKYRIWNAKAKTMTYLQITFPAEYTSESDISLTSFMPEKEGILFSFSLMQQVLNSQIESIKETLPE